MSFSLKTHHNLSEISHSLVVSLTFHYSLIITLDLFLIRRLSPLPCKVKIRQVASVQLVGFAFRFHRLIIRPLCLFPCGRCLWAATSAGSPSRTAARRCLTRAAASASTASADPPPSPKSPVAPAAGNRCHAAHSASWTWARLFPTAQVNWPVWSVPPRHGFSSTISLLVFVLDTWIFLQELASQTRRWTWQGRTNWPSSTTGSPGATSVDTAATRATCSAGSGGTRTAPRCRLVFCLFALILTVMHRQEPDDN